MTFQDFIDYLEGQILARHEWLATHGTHSKKWPQPDIDAKRKGLEIMENMRMFFVRERDAVDRAQAQQGSLL